MEKLKAVYYINQFFAGIGGEAQAGIGLEFHDTLKGPAIGISKFWKDDMDVVKVISCGDNFINKEENFEKIKEEVRHLLEEIKPDVFIAGPAFNAGRYGVACAKICDFVNKELSIPSVTAMYYENPAVQMYVRDNYIVETPETAAGMRKALPKLAALALKLAKGETIGASRFEGYLPRGYRYNEYHEKTAAERVVNILLKKLNNKPYRTEVPPRTFESVSPANAVSNVTDIKIGIFTTGGLVPAGNPDKLKQAFSVDYGCYDISSLESLPVGEYESIHGGYDTTNVNNDPNRLVPYDALIALEKEGYFRELDRTLHTTCGVGTNVESAKRMGTEVAQDFIANQVQAVILTTT